MVEKIKNELIELIHGPWQSALDGVTGDCLITDPPYSPKTHNGHNAGVKQANRREDLYHGRRDVDYQAMTETDVRNFVDSWAPRIENWIVIMTDHISYFWYREALERHNRYVFAPIPFVDYGIRPRLLGDGPASWTSFMVVSRPRTKKHAKWRSLPGAYITPIGSREKRYVMGGKPLNVMKQIVNDYTNDGDTVIDPFAGGATTLIAAGIKRRKSIGCEISEQVFTDACNRIKKYVVVKGE